MRTIAIILLSVAMAVPAAAAVVHDESVDGDLSSDPNAPTALVFTPGVNTVTGTISGLPIDRDFITFTIAPDHQLAHMYMTVFAPPNDKAFMAFNVGTTSYIPTLATDGLFLSGIHMDANDLNMDLMPLFVNRNVTTEALLVPMLPPGDYCWMIQQVSAIVQSYSFDFVIETTIPAEVSTWGKVKALYR